MSLKNIKQIQSERGFTIVELLIVIVVIGILAAIVIVSYNGVTQSANTNKAKTNAQSAQSVAEAMNADETTNYPTTLAQFNTGSPTAKLPQGLSLVTPGCATDTACDTVAERAAVAGGTGGIPTSGNNMYSTLAVYRTSTNAGGVIIYRVNSSTVGELFFGDGTPTSIYRAM